MAKFFRQGLIALTAIFICSSLMAAEPLQETSENSGAALGALETYQLVREMVNASLPKESPLVSKVVMKLEFQEEKIKLLERKVHQLEVPQDNDAAAIVLTAVSVIVTVLGVLIAILSIIGYSNLKKEAIKSSQQTAQETIDKRVEEGLRDATEKSIIKLIEQGRFDEIIQNAIANIEYRGISIPDGIPDEEKPL